MPRPPAHRFQRWSSVTDHDQKTVLPLAKVIARTNASNSQVDREAAIDAAIKFSEYQVEQNHLRMRTNIQGMELRNLDIQKALETCLQRSDVSNYRTLALAVSRMGYYLHLLPNAINSITAKRKLTPLQYLQQQSQITWSHLVAITKTVDTEVPRYPVNPLYSASEYLVKEERGHGVLPFRPDGFYDYVHSIDELIAACRRNSAICAKCVQHVIDEDLTPRQLHLRAARIISRS